jgi:hypothetical protein
MKWVNAWNNFRTGLPAPTTSIRVQGFGTAPSSSDSELDVCRAVVY